VSPVVTAEVSDASGGSVPYGIALAAAAQAAVAGWVVRCVNQVMTAWKGEVPPEVAEAASTAGARAALELGLELRELLARDIDDQRSTPLAILRSGVRYPAEVLRQAGAPVVPRDEFVRRSFPDDDYDLSPATWSDIDPGLAEAGLQWSAAKAFEHMRRHKS
jgi:hypothetical protein